MDGGYVIYHDLSESRGACVAVDPSQADSVKYSHLKKLIGAFDEAATEMADTAEGMIDESASRFTPEELCKIRYELQSFLSSRKTDLQISEFWWSSGAAIYSPNIGGARKFLELALQRLIFHQRP